MVHCVVSFSMWAAGQSWSCFLAEDSDKNQMAGHHYSLPCPWTPPRPSPSFGQYQITRLCGRHV